MGHCAAGKTARAEALGEIKITPVDMYHTKLLYRMKGGKAMFSYSVPFDSQTKKKLADISKVTYEVMGLERGQDIPKKDSF